ncbi:MAG: 30S ribosomal protein S17 [Candidatus Pacebacteria bacterium]|nr:30S ribosomal protein S17 [Candidatus Paceibacterota bacterium]
MTTKDTQKNKKILQGTVVGTAMQDTVKVAVSRYVKHPKYKKFMKKVKNFLVHDAGNTTKVGDKVTIEECKPISKTKHFTLKK